MNRERFDFKAFREEANRLSLAIDRENPISLEGHNTVLPLRDETDKGWIGKKEEIIGNIYDSLSREGLASELASELGFPIPKAAIVTYEDEQIVISERIEARALRQLREDGNIDNISKEQLSNIMVFSHWLGDQDRNLGNVLIDGAGKAWSIDYGIAGPGGRFELKQNIVWPCEFEDYQRIGIGVDDSLTEFILCDLGHRFSMADFDKLIRRIERLDGERIKEIVESYYLYKERTYDRISSEYADELIRRKQNLRSVFERFVEWINAQS